MEPTTKKRNHKRNKKSSVCQQLHSPKLTKTQAEVLAFLDKEGLTTGQIAARRGVSKRAVRKIRAQLEAKGYLSKKVPPELGDYGTCGTKKLRVHAQKFRIQLLEKGKNYNPNVNDRLDGNSLQFYQDCIFLQANDKNFHGESLEEALFLSMEYWERIFRRIENVYDVKILKPRNQNIKLVYMETASEDSQLCKSAEMQAKRIRIFSELDGKLRFTTDMSKGYEHEYHHQKTMLPDVENGERHFNDFLDFDGLTHSELANVVRDMLYIMHTHIKLQYPIPQGTMQTPTEKPSYIG